MNHQLPVEEVPANEDALTAGEIKPASNQKPLLIAGVVALVLGLGCCVLLAGALLLFDPFNLQILDRIMGRWDAAAEAMPEDTLMYVGVNLLNITPDRLERVLIPFQDVLADEMGEPVLTLDDLQTRLDTEVLASLDMTFAEDIQPWIGQYLGLGLVDIQLGQYGDLESMDFVVSVETRNKKAADAFLEKLRTEISERSGSAFIETEYRDVMLYELSPSGGGEPFAFARSGNLLLFSNQSRNLKESIDDQNQSSLASVPVFKQLAKQLPKDRIMSVYISGEQLTDLLHNSSQSFGGVGLADNYRYIEGLAMSASIVDEGVQVDWLAVYDPEEMSPEQEAMSAVSADKLELVDALPTGTVFYVGGSHLDLVWLANKAALAQTSGMGEDWNSAMSLFAEQYGFNPDTDLFPYLDGEWGLAIMPAEDGILAQQMRIPMGALLAADTSAPDQLAGVVDRFTGSLQSMGAPVEDVIVGDATLKQISDPMMGPMLTFGLSDSRLVVASSSGVVGRLTEDQETLAKSAPYREAVKALPRGTTPIMYLDLEKLFEDIRSSLSAEFLHTFEESINYLEPVQKVMMGNAAVQKNLAHSVMVIFIQSK